MMKKKITLLTFLIVAIINAQTPDSLKNKWFPSLVTSLGINQISFTNWQAGGDNSVSWTLSGNFKLNRESDLWGFRNQVKASYGRTKTGGSIYKTIENEFYLEAVVAYNVGWSVSPYFSNSIRTQITKGYDYTVNGSPNISDFFDPGYITQTFGFTYDQYKKIIPRIGLAFQEVFADKFTQYTDDEETLDEIEKFKFETGLETVTDLNFLVDTNLLYSGKLRLFTRFESLDVWDVRWDNAITAKVNSWLNVNFNYVVLYEKDQSLLTQTKESLQIGITYSWL
ncbi:MAG: DUF3078 domain-containing protein [Ignavibacteria bacterium]|jgi:hypothetical protein